MKNYLLFLDESKPTGTINHFCLAGCIIEEKNYSNEIIPRVNNLKTTVFGTSNVILHEIDIRAAKEPPYTMLRIKEKRDLFWINMQNIFSEDKITTIGTAINCAEYNRIYNPNSANEEYFVAMQIILENYLHFLIVNEGVGSIYIESRNTTDDNRLRNNCDRNIIFG